jgi:hypothetical protein
MYYLKFKIDDNGNNYLQKSSETAGQKLFAGRNVFSVRNGQTFKVELSFVLNKRRMMDIVQN